MIIFTKIPRNFFFFLRKKSLERQRSTVLVRVHYLWAPKFQRMSHTFTVFVFSVAKCSVAYSILVRTFLCSKPFSFSSTWTLVLSSINSMTESFLCFFLHIFFQFVLHFLLFLYQYVPPLLHSLQSISYALRYTKPLINNSEENPISLIFLQIQGREKIIYIIFFFFISSFNGLGVHKLEFLD